MIRIINKIYNWLKDDGACLNNNSFFRPPDPVGSQQYTNYVKDCWVKHRLQHLGYNPPQPNILSFDEWLKKERMKKEKVPIPTQWSPYAKLLALEMFPEYYKPSNLLEEIERTNNVL